MEGHNINCQLQVVCLAYHICKEFVLMMINTVHRSFNVVVVSLYATGGSIRIHLIAKSIDMTGHSHQHH